MKITFAHGDTDTLKTLHPAYFALVMATGIVSTAASIHGVPYFPKILFFLNTLFLPVLLGLNLIRFITYKEYFIADICNHNRSVGFFTTVAACAIYGGQVLTYTGNVLITELFWGLTLIFWFAITYGVFTTLAVQKHKPDLASSLHGGWLVSVVATQALSIFTVTLATITTNDSWLDPLLFAALVLWLGGGMLYIWIMTLIFFRYTFYRMSAADFTPPYWINMGAVAISTLAGATLLQNSDLSPVITHLEIFIKGLTLMYWSIGSWWIPMLVFMGVWRYLFQKVPFSYHPLYWGGVFPLGMYCVSTYQLAQVLKVPFLMPISQFFMVCAIAAWSLAFIGLIDSRLRKNTSLIS